ncbi:SDR family oxidoreductase [Rhodoferax sp.]|uniref:SDR family oxidoreductase n=1 Tax=Rhodoferax sp. TaxID=50421 RepID=UPI0025D9AD5F|nr:SDR family oxidoreductase [Rhodoferax sp.]
MSKLVFITGASSGLGQAMALRFFQAGYRLALVARRTSVVESWASAQGISTSSYQIYSADVAVPDSIIAAGRACIASQGVPDVVVASAGISIGMDTAMLEDIAVMAKIFVTNNTGMAATFQPFLQAMVQRGSGALVGIGSVAGIRGLPGHGAYCASKAAVIAYCESLRGELRPSGVKVVTICPGYINTPLTQKNGYSLPFLMQPDTFANKAFVAIEAGVSYRVIPWQMGIVAKLMRLLPNAMFDKLLVGRARKPRQSADSQTH